MDIEKIEKVQMRATRMVQKLRKYSHTDDKARLRYPNLSTLKYRRLRVDMIQVYNIVSGKQ